ncbi:hypothetical protein D4R52_01695 [bacterium]|nr:MAG: hypothetical protein D4R52_01695 [bacterium]
MKKTIAFIVTLVLSHFTAYPIGHWFASRYFGSGEFYFGPFRGYLDGLSLSYIFYSSFLLSIFTGKFKIGFYFALPVLVFDLILGAFNPQLWMDFILLAAGLGLAWLILLIKNKKSNAKLIR